MNLDKLVDVSFYASILSFLAALLFAWFSADWAAAFIVMALCWTMVMTATVIYQISRTLP